MVLSKSDIETRLTELMSRYKPNLRGNLSGLVRETFLVGLSYRPNGHLIDLGGGISPHNGVLAQLGMTLHVLDLLDTYWEHRAINPTGIAEEIRALEAAGVRFRKVDLPTHNLCDGFAAASVDVITSFECLEHFSQSPRELLEHAMQVLKPGGCLIISVPNAVNIRKRLAVLLGRTNYPPYNELYYGSPYLGHVREYTDGDLRQLARNLGAGSFRIFGKNFIHGSWAKSIPSPARQIVDRGLQVFPGLCGSLFLQIWKT